MIVKNCLEAGKFCHAIVNCGEGYSLRLLFENIVNQLTKHELNVENNYQSYAKCTNFLEFVHVLQNISNKLNIGNTNDDKSLSIIIVSMIFVIKGSHFFFSL